MNRSTLPPVLLSLLFATPYETQPHLLKCSTCPCFLDNVSRLPDGCFRLSCRRCPHPQYKFYCPVHKFLSKNSHSHSNHKYHLHRPNRTTNITANPANFADTQLAPQAPPPEIYIPTTDDNSNDTPPSGIGVRSQLTILPPNNVIPSKNFSPLVREKIRPSPYKILFSTN